MHEEINKSFKDMVSIIIVQYHVKEELFDCLTSIIASKPKTSYEIIVVDNDEKKEIKHDLLKKFPKVVYVPNENKGFGQGNNTGTKYAKGEYLFFLNPDTVVFEKTIDVLIQFLQKNIKAGVVAPFLLHKDKKPFTQQGVKELTPLRAIFSLSFLNKLFPNNPIAKRYFIQWNKITTKEVDVVPGTAFMIKKDLYTSLNGFDEHFFLYFEEFDLCKRIKERGYKLFIEPKAKIIHLWERSTKKRNDIDKIFNESRFYYFRKHFGLLPALFINAILNFGKYSLLSLLILFVATFLLFYKIAEFMPFIGDEGWFYLSARDMLLTGHIPLVGITSSHTWLHQGPLWTYLLAVALFLGNFNPVSGAYLTAGIGLFSVWLIYKIGSEMFSPRIGVTASLFYAISPLIISTARTPYHISLIPLFTLLWLYVFYKWINGFSYGFPVLLFILAILYNFELSMVMLVPILAIVFFYGITKKTTWIMQLKSLKLMVLSFFSILIPMIPMILYDIHHGYPQTVRFGIWIVYKIVNIIGISLAHSDIPGETYQSMISFLSVRLSQLFFLPNALVAWAILFVSFVSLVIINTEHFKRKIFLSSYSLLLLLFLIPVLFYFAEKTNSDAYLPVFFPTLAFMFALFFDKLLLIPKWYYVSFGLLGLYTIVSIWTYLHSDYLNREKIWAMTDRIVAAKKIIKESGGKEYNLIGYGPGSKYASFTMNYQYLTWWLGHEPTKTNQKIHIYIVEKELKVFIQKKITK